MTKLESILTPEAVLRVQLDNILPLLAPLVENDGPLFWTTYPDGIIRWFSSERKHDLSDATKNCYNILMITCSPILWNDSYCWDIGEVFIKNIAPFLYFGMFGILPYSNEWIVYWPTAKYSNAKEHSYQSRSCNMLLNDFWLVMNRQELLFYTVKEKARSGFSFN